MITTLFFLAALMVGVPIGVCLCLSGAVYILSIGSPVLFQSFPMQMFGGVDSYGLIAIPLFILIGEIMNSGGITRRLVDLSMAFIGSVKGGLAYVNILANMLVSSIIGSATAQVAIMSQVMVPEMEKQGYDKTFAAGLTVYGGMLGPIIPPSVMFVVYSVLAQVAGILGRHDISLVSVLQKGRAEGEAVPVVMMTHEARERDMRAALAAIDRLPVVAARTTMIRVEPA